MSVPAPIPTQALSAPYVPHPIRALTHPAVLYHTLPGPYPTLPNTPPTCVSVSTSDLSAQKPPHESRYVAS